MQSGLRFAAAVLCFLSSWSIPARAAETLHVAPVTRKVLANGLTILVREDHSAPVISAQAWVRAGSITEGHWVGAGLSHVLEHMLFKGTTKRGVAEIAQEIDDKGGYMNAYTSFEQTVFHIDMPAANWRTAVDILADCMMHATVPEKELLKEKRVILRELAMNEDDPDRRASRVLWSTAYTVHPYRHPVIGYTEVYNRITRDDVMAYYRAKYLPNNIVFVVVGDVRTPEVIADIETLTKDFQRGALAADYIPAEPPQLSLRRRDEEMAVQLTQVQLAWHIPGFTSPDMYALDVLAIVLGQGRSSRMYRDLQEQQGLVHSIGAGSFTPAQPGLFSVEATTDPDKRDAAIAAIRAAVAAVTTGQVSAAELQKAIKQSTSDYVGRLKTMDGQAGDIADHQILVDDPDFATRYLANLQQVTPADLQRVAAKYFTDNNLTIATLNPTGTVATATAPATAKTDIRIQKFELPNGLRLLVREDPKLPLASFQVLFKGGVLAETPANNGLTKLTARMLLKGTATRTADQIAETIESVGGDISYFAGNNSFGVSAQVLSSELDPALDVLADVVQHPSFPAELLERERSDQIAEIKNRDDQVMPVAQQVLRETLYQHHPYRLDGLGSIDTVGKLTRDDLRRFHQQFIVPNNLVLCVFGNVKADAVRRAVEDRFGKMPRQNLAFPVAPPEQLAQSATRTKYLPREQAVLLIGFPAADLFSKDRFALELLDAAYSGLGSRIFYRIRDELGLAYYVGARQLLGLGAGHFVFYVGTTAPKVATCQEELFAELKKLQADGLTQAELDRAKNSLIGQQQIARQDNGQLALTVGLDELYGLGYDFSLTKEGAYRAVTMDDIKRIAAKYFGDKPHAIAIVRPPDKSPAAPEH